MFSKKLDSYTKNDIKEAMHSIGEKPYRGLQLFKWLHGKREYSVERMTDLSKDFRKLIKDDDLNSYMDKVAEIVSEDGSVKFSFEMEDKSVIESVLLKNDEKITACVSSQVGCKMGCKFCVSATLGFKRNLTAGEIVKQAEYVASYALKNLGIKLLNIVFMGIGEPLDNVINVKDAISILTDDDGCGLSRKKITVSTCGVIDNMPQLFGKQSEMPNIAVSINATTDELRDEIMPINKKFNLKMLIEALKNIPIASRSRITLEYVMLSGVNDTLQDANRLAKIAQQIPVKINLIPFNEGRKYERPKDVNVLQFQEHLTKKGFSVFIRKSLGRGIGGACGQLAGNTMRDKV